MQKTYERINWENYPSDKTPLNETNLNKLDVATDEIDNRVITLDSTKFDKTEASKLIKNFELDKATGIITITYLSGATVTIDTLLEKLAINFDFDEATQKIIITLDDGTVKEVDLSSFITDYEFLDSDTVAFTVDANGKVVAIVKEGSIEEKHLRPNYLADIKVEVAKAESSVQQAEAQANASKDYSDISRSYAIGTNNEIRQDDSTDNSKYYYQESKKIYDNFSSASNVYGVKGEKETEYRSGFVNITAENVGAVSKTGDTMTGDLKFACSGNNEKGIYWKETNYGDKFKIVPFFEGVDNTNKLLIQSAVGEYGTDPELTTKVSIAGKTGDVEFVGNVTAPSFIGGLSAYRIDGSNYNGVYNLNAVFNKYYDSLGAFWLNIQNNSGDNVDYKVGTDYAVQALRDINGNNIAETYATLQNMRDNFNNYGHWGSAFFNSNDVNTWIKAGIYCTITSQDFNLPSQIDGWSTVLVLASNGASGRITQICWGWNDASYTLYKRGTGNSGANWSDWVAIVDEGNITRCITPNKIGAVESRKITEPIDFNQFQETGMFYINFLGASNQPVDAHGLLIVNFDIGTPFHIFIPDTVNVIVKRNWHGTYWSDWYNAIDTLYNKGTITTNSQILNTATDIEASTSSDNIVGVQGLKEYVGKSTKVYTVPAGGSITIGATALGITTSALMHVTVKEAHEHALMSIIRDNSINAEYLFSKSMSYNLSSNIGISDTDSGIYIKNNRTSGEVKIVVTAIA